MTYHLKTKKIIAVILLSGFSSLVAANAHIDTQVSTQENDNLAPEVSAADAKLSFRDMPHLKKAFIDTTPTAREDNISVGALGNSSGDKDMIVTLANEIANGKHGQFDSLLIAHKDKLVFESYYLRGRVNLPHHQMSATKSYVSLAIGRAIQLGYLTMADLDKPIVSFFERA